MTAEPTHNVGLNALTAALRSLGRATLPAGFDDTVATFDDMMTAIDAMPPEVKDGLANEAEAHNLGADAFALAVAFLERGDLGRAEQWFRCAERYHVPQAAARLSDLTELRETMAGLVNPGLSQIGETLDCGRDATLRLDDSWILFQTKHHVADMEPQAHARQIIADAEREAAAILVRAKMQAARIAVHRATSNGSSFTVDFVSPSTIDAGPGQDPVPLMVEVLPDLTADRGFYVFTHGPGSGKTAALSQLLTEALNPETRSFAREGSWLPCVSHMLDRGWSLWSAARLATADGTQTGSCRRSTLVRPVQTWDVDVLDEALREAACNPRLRRHIRNLAVHGLGACGSELVEALSSSMGRTGFIFEGGRVNLDSLFVILQDETRRHEIGADVNSKRLVVAR